MAMKRDSFPQAVQRTMPCPRVCSGTFWSISSDNSSFVTLGEAVSAANPTLGSKLLTFNFFNFQISLWFTELETKEDWCSYF